MRLFIHFWLLAKNAHLLNNCGIHIKTGDSLNNQGDLLNGSCQKVLQNPADHVMSHLKIATTYDCTFGHNCCRKTRVPEFVISFQVKWELNVPIPHWPRSTPPNPWQPPPHLDLAFAHNAVRGLAVFFALVVALLVAQDPQRLGSLQLDLKLLWERRAEPGAFQQIPK